MSERLQSVEQTWVDDVTGKTRKSVSNYDEKGAKMGSDKPEEIPQGELPADFPGRDILRRAGYGTIEAVRQFRRRGPFTRIEGIDSLTANAIEFVIASTPEDDAEAAQATKADAQATATNTKVSDGGGGSEATGPVPPAKDTRRGAKQDGSVGSDSTLGDVADATDGEGTPVAGHGVEGFIVADKDNPQGSHLTTNLSLAPGATKTSPVSDGGDDSTEETEQAEETPQLRGKLSDDFPHKKELEEAGLGTYAKLRKAVAKDGWHKDVAGIGDAKAKAIEEALNLPEPSEE